MSLWDAARSPSKTTSASTAALPTYKSEFAQQFGERHAVCMPHDSTRSRSLSL